MDSPAPGPEASGAPAAADIAASRPLWASESLWAGARRGDELGAWLTLLGLSEAEAAAVSERFTLTQLGMPAVTLTELASDFTTVKAEPVTRFWLECNGIASERQEPALRAQKRDLVEMAMTAETAKSPDMQIEQKEALRLELEGRSWPEHCAAHTFGGLAQGTFSVSWILQQLNDASDVVTVLFLDCCRDNPQNETFTALGMRSTAVTKSFGDTDGGIVSDSQIFAGLACVPGTAA